MYLCQLYFLYIYPQYVKYRCPLYVMSVYISPICNVYLSPICYVHIYPLSALSSICSRYISSADPSSIYSLPIPSPNFQKNPNPPTSENLPPVLKSPDLMRLHPMPAKTSGHLAHSEALVFLDCVEVGNVQTRLHGLQRVPHFVLHHDFGARGQAVLLQIRHGLAFLHVTVIHSDYCLGQLIK